MHCANWSKTFPIQLLLMLCVGGFLFFSGCSFGPNNPNVQNAMEMLRVERDAAEDEYYNLKQKHDEAMWKIEDLETQIKSIQEGDDVTEEAGEDLRPISHIQSQSFLDSGNEYSPTSLTTEVPASNNEAVSEVAYIDIDTQMTKGFDSHGKPGDDGIIVALKPMDESGNFLPIAAPVQIALIDPARSGIRQRVGLWRFTSKQVATRIDHRNQVFLFRLPWQRNAPIHSDLRLFVRFQADDGKRETEMNLTVSIDGQPPASVVPVAQNTQSGQWTEIKKSGSVTSPSPNSIQSPLVESNFESSSGASESSTKIARPQWSPYR